MPPYVMMASAHCVRRPPSDSGQREIRSAMTRAYLAHIASAALRIGLIVLMLAASGSHAAEPKRILIVHSFGHSTSPYDLVSSAFRKGILDAWPGQAAFYDFALEAGRPVDNNESAIIEVIRNRFDGTKLD